MKTRLVLALLASPVAAAADLFGSYVWVGVARARHDRSGFHLIAAGSLLLIAIGVLVAAGSRPHARTSGDRFLAISAIVLGAFFALLVAGFEVPVLLLGVED